MIETSASKSPAVRTLLWTLVSVAAMTSVVAIHFALQARREHSRAESYLTALAAKDRELTKTLSELEKRHSASTASGNIASPQPRQQLRSQAVLADALPTPNNSSDARALFHTPAMREMFRQGTARTLRPIYDPLLSQLNLSPDQRRKFYDLQLAVDNPEIMLEKLPSEADTPEERTQIKTEIKQTRDSALAEIQRMFGSGEYQLYEEYRQTQGERMMVQEFCQQFDSGSTPINDWQSARLRDLLIQARRQYPPVNDDTTSSDEAALAQATQYLTPDQLAAFRNYLRNQEDMAREVRKLHPGG
jgi:hypothetical protein